MSFKTIPLTPSPDQTFKITIPVDGKNLKLKLRVRFNSAANYWVMSVYGASSNTLILDSIPLLTGKYPAGDLLGQYRHLGLGSATIINTGNSMMDSPDSTNLGTDFILTWGDTI